MARLMPNARTWQKLANGDVLVWALLPMFGTFNAKAKECVSFGYLRPNPQETRRISVIQLDRTKLSAKVLERSYVGKLSHPSFAEATALSEARGVTLTLP